MKPVVYRKQPLPNDLINGGTVVASTVLHDDDARPVTWVLLVLQRSAPFYEVIEVDEHGQVTELGEHANIVPAVEQYQDNGGDY